MQIHEFFAQVDQRNKFNKRERIGESAFKILCEIRPDLAEKLKFSPIDPYYLTDKNQSVWTKFVCFIKDNW